MIGAVLCLLAIAPARAGVVVRPGVPFTADDLSAAILARGGQDPAKLDVDVSRANATHLVLIAPGGRWDIDIGAATGKSAARVVALHVIELRTAAAAAPAPVTARIVRPGGSAAGEPRRYRLAALGMASRSPWAGGSYTAIGGAVDLTRSGDWLVGAGVAWHYGLATAEVPGASLAVELLRVRADAGVVLGPAEVIATGFAGRASVDGGTGQTVRWVTGIAAEAHIAAAISPACAVVFAVGAELFRERIEVPWAGTTIAAIPRAALSAGLGVAWTMEVRP